MRTPSFLAGNGEMASLTRAFDWPSTSIGPIDTWPQSLRTTLAAVLRSRLPMFLWWGPELLCFYNDAFRASLGSEGKHPSILGRPAREAWSEIWHIIGPQVEHVLEKGDGTWNEDLLMPIFRNGAIEDVYWTFGYSPVITEDEVVGGILVTGMETTSKVKTQALLAEKARQLEIVIASADIGFWDRDLVTGNLSYNDRLKEFFGFAAHENPTSEDFLQRIREEDRQRLRSAMAKSQTPGSGGDFDVEYSVIIAATKQERTVRVKGKTMFDAQNLPIRFTGTLQDITERTWTLKAIERSQREILELFEEAPVAIATLTADHRLQFVSANHFYGELVGRKPSDIVGKPLLESLPELKGQGFEDILKDVMTSGKPYMAYEIPVDLRRNDSLEKVYVNFSYIPRQNRDGVVTGILVTALDVSFQVRVRRAIEEKEALLRSLIKAAPFPIGVYLGKNLEIAHANPAIVEVYGKGPDVIGKKYLELLPELTAQGIDRQIKQVYDTGRSFFSDTRRVDIQVNSGIQSYYFKYNFIPLFDNTGVVYGILNTGVDVTEVELSRQRALEAEANLRSAVEVAELANWTIDIAAGVIQLSQRLKEWTGVNEDAISLEQFYMHVPELWRPQIMKAYQQGLSAAPDTIFDCEHPIYGQGGTHTLFVHARGRVITSGSRNGLLLTGTMQDITAQRNLQWALEKEVAQRTAELASLNTALQAANRELERKNAALQYSNEELSQYAYVTSHDLQEPLRKIRFYISILEEKLKLPAEADRILQKINKSSTRMTQLIQDLLGFSRLLGSGEVMQQVDLNVAVAAVLEDFELSIQEKQAAVHVGPLPVLWGIPLQLNQLFHNLIGNALKFNDPERTPLIRISARLLSPEELPAAVSHIGHIEVYDITVADNGIGFEMEFQHYIFDLFKQLHSRDTYQGSGIGLSLCRRIAANHGGHIYVTSQIGAGSEFHVLLPAGTAPGSARPQVRIA